MSDFYTSPADRTYPSTLSQGALMKRQAGFDLREDRDMQVDREEALGVSSSVDPMDDPRNWPDLEQDIAMLECEIYRERNRVKALKSQPNYDHKEALTRLTWIKNMTKALNKKKRERSGK